MDNNKTRNKKTADFGKDKILIENSEDSDEDDIEGKLYGSKDISASKNLDKEAVDASATEEQKRENDKALRRWGKVIDMQSYTPGSVIRLITLVVAIFLIPMQLFCDGLV